MSSDSRIMLDPRRMLFHIGRDKEWQKVDVNSLLESDEKALPTPTLNTSKSGQLDNNNDPLDELTVKQMMEIMERANDPTNMWDDQGITRIMFLADTKKDWNQGADKFNKLNSIQFSTYNNINSDSEQSEQSEP